MNPADVLPILLDRLAAADGDAAIFSAVELAEWPAPIVARLKADSLLVASTPAASVICPGCEEDCAMPVETASTASGAWRAFVACDKGDDTARVPIPAALLEQWQCTPAQLATQLAKFLALRRPLSDDDPKRLDLGVLKGTQGSAHVVLHVEGPLTLHIAGHVLTLADVMDWTDKGLTVERRELLRCVNSPVAAAGSVESAGQRKARLRQRRNELKTSGIHNFNQVLAKEEGISVSAIKQLLAEKKQPKNWLGLMPAAKETVQKKPKPQR